MWYRYGQLNNKPNLNQPVFSNGVSLIYTSMNGQSYQEPLYLNGQENPAIKQYFNIHTSDIPQNQIFYAPNIGTTSGQKSPYSSLPPAQTQPKLDQQFFNYQKQQGSAFINQGYSLDQAKAIVNSPEFIQQYKNPKPASKDNPVLWIDKDSQEYILYTDKDGKQQKEPAATAKQKLGLDPNHLPSTNDPNFVKKHMPNWNFNDPNTKLTAKAPGYYDNKDKYSVKGDGSVSEPTKGSTINTSTVKESDLSSAKNDTTNTVHLVKNEKGDFEVWANGQKTQRTFINDTGQKPWSADDAKSALQNSPPPAVPKKSIAPETDTTTSQVVPQQKEAPKQPATPEQKPK